MEYSNETEEKILKAAREIFIRDGRDGARMEEIARHAGLNKALLHYYFRSKEKLYRMVFQKEFQQVVSDLFQSLEPDLIFRDFLLSFINNYINRLQQHPHIVGFLLWEIRRGGEDFSVTIKNILLQNDGFLPEGIIKKINHAIQKKEIRALDSRHLFMNLIAMCIYTFITEPLLSIIFPDVEVNSEKFLEIRKNEIFKLIWNGIQP
ncbi:MAG: TetR/AcrR family transcriptional regulator [Calditrichaeota bacterium]|nr:TetR/AcrR family transcriptional regulator [Calditrichota bacterium]